MTKRDSEGYVHRIFPNYTAFKIDRHVFRLPWLSYFGQWNCNVYNHVVGMCLLWWHLKVLQKQDVKEWRDFTLGPRVINQF